VQDLAESRSDQRNRNCDEAGARLARSPHWPTGSHPRVKHPAAHQTAHGLRPSGRISSLCLSLAWSTC
jgi:hypothetical protein